MGFDVFRRRAAFTGKTFVKATSAANQFAGLTTIASGTSTITVSTSVVKSDSLIFHAFRTNFPTAALTPFFLNVNTVVDSSYFSFATNIAVIGPVLVSWEIKGT